MSLCRFLVCAALEQAPTVSGGEMCEMQNVSLKRRGIAFKRLGAISEVGGRSRAIYSSSVNPRRKGQDNLSFVTVCTRLPFGVPLVDVE